jgi:predicted membrane protein
VTERRPARRRIAGSHHRARSLGSWIAALFMMGSFLFALGAFPLYADAVDPRLVGVTFFVGSILFTSAGYLQYVQVVDAEEERGGVRERTKLLAWQPERIDWWAASVQSVGTILFNVSTFAALLTTLDLRQEDRLVWAPDMFGSVAFLVASSLAWGEVCHGAWAFRPRDVAWWIVLLNLAGSIAFQISAVAAFVRPATGEVASLPVSNLGTFVGAVGFLVGAYLLVPEMRRAAAVGG